MSEYTFQNGDQTITLTKEEYEKIQAALAELEKQNG
jgi:hypothetical protein